MSPAELLQRAQTEGVSVLAITDHDTLAAYDALPDSFGLKLIQGIEFSTVWRHTGIHVLGLNLDLDHAPLQSGVASQQQARQTRLRTILNRLKRKGLPVSETRVLEIAGDSQPGRPHVAQHLVELGLVRDEHQAFDHYLGAGKIGDVKQDWAPLDAILDWINGAGGVAVLAHPAHYALTRTKRVELLQDFKALGGRGMEVVSGHQDQSITSDLLRMCCELDLLGSCGSDFHRPGLSRELGSVGLPSGCRPVWENWAL